MWYEFFLSNKKESDSIYFLEMKEKKKVKNVKRKSGGGWWMQFPFIIGKKMKCSKI